MLQIGSLIDGKYRVLSQIGRGGMSVVYMAINEKANKTWAIKEVRKDGVMDYEAVKQGLIAETDMLKNLSHPHLPSIVDVIDDKDSFLIVMDYIEGISLKSQLDEFGAQPQEDVIKWAKQLCEVFAYLHSRPKPIIYRDMKPGNVMLKPNGDVVLIDFGTAREFKTTSVDDTKCLGTIGYAAPEQFGGMGQTDARTDIYCLGATMYHLVTGCNPSAPPYEILPIRQINESLSAGLEQIIIKCTQQNPNNRYQSAAELMYALENYMTLDAHERRKQKRKLGTFIGCIALSVACLGAGIGLIAKANMNAAQSYDMKLDEAQQAMNTDDKIQLYLDCIDIPTMAGRKDAYIGLFEAFKSTTSDTELPVFTAEERKRGLDVVQDDSNIQALKEDPRVYAEVCYELGKLIWYYSEESDKTQRATNATTWFDKAKEYGTDEDSFLGTAKAYSAIGHFYKEIQMSINEGTDKGMYTDLFKNIDQILQEIGMDPDEPEIVRLEVYEMARSLLERYATKLKIDGITYEEVRDLYNRIYNTFPEVDATSEKTMQMKNDINSMLAGTLEKIEIAFNTK